MTTVTTELKELGTEWCVMFTPPDGVNTCTVWIGYGLKAAMQWKEEFLNNDPRYSIVPYDEYKSKVQRTKPEPAISFDDMVAKHQETRKNPRPEEANEAELDPKRV